MNKKISILFLAVLFITALGTSALEGSGTEEDPYIIEDGEDFQEAGTQYSNYPDPTYFSQEDDIEIDDSMGSDGNDQETVPMMRYDGNGYVISGEALSTVFGERDLEDYETEKFSNILFKDFDFTGYGLIEDEFGQASSDPSSDVTFDVTNVSLVDSTIDGVDADYVGGFFREGTEASINFENCFITNTTYKNMASNTGGFVGKNELGTTSFEKSFYVNTTGDNPAYSDVGTTSKATVESSNSFSNHDSHEFESTSLEDIKDQTFLDTISADKEEFFDQSPYYQRSDELGTYDESLTDGVPNLEPFDKFAPEIELKGSSRDRYLINDYEGNRYVIGDRVFLTADISETGHSRMGLTNESVEDLDISEAVDIENISKVGSQNQFIFGSEPSESGSIEYDIETGEDEDVEETISNMGRIPLKANASDLAGERTDKDDYVMNESKEAFGIKEGDYGVRAVDVDDDEFFNKDLVGYWNESDYGWNQEMAVSGYLDEADAILVYLYKDGNELISESVSSEGTFLFKEFDFLDEGTSNFTGEYSFDYPNDGSSQPMIYEDEETATVINSSEADIDIGNETFKNDDYDGQRIKYYQPTDDEDYLNSDSILVNFDMECDGCVLKEEKEEKLFRTVTGDEEKYHTSIGFDPEGDNELERGNGTIEIETDESVSFDLDSVDELGLISWVNWNNQEANDNFVNDVKIEFRDPDSNDVVVSDVIEPIVGENQTLDMREYMSNLETNEEYQVVLKKMEESTSSTLGTSTINISDVEPLFANINDEEGAIIDQTAFVGGEDIEYDYLRYPDEEGFYDQLDFYISDDDRTKDGFNFKPVFKGEYGNETLIDEKIVDLEILVDSAVEVEHDIRTNPATNEVKIIVTEGENLSFGKFDIYDENDIFVEDIYLSEMDKSGSEYTYTFENFSVGSYDYTFDVEDSIENSESSEGSFIMPEDDRWSELKGWISEYSGMGFHTVGFIITILATLVGMLFGHAISGDKGKGFGSEKITLFMGGVTLTFCFMTGILSGSNYAGVLAVVLGAIASFEFGSW